MYCRNHTFYENFKLKLCTCAQSHALGTCTKFHLEILTINVISGIVYFRKIILDISWNISETTPNLSGSLAKPQLNYRFGHEITSHSFTWMWYFTHILYIMLVYLFAVSKRCPSPSRLSLITHPTCHIHISLRFHSGALSLCDWTWNI